MAVLETPTIDFLILADHAEALNGKIYLMGGGWDVRAVRDFSQPVPLTLALAVLVPWTATNQRHQLRLRVEDADGRQLAEVKGEFVAGRPPHLTAGTSQRIPLAFQHIPVLLGGPGVYAIIATLNDQGEKRTTFSAVAAPREGTGGQPAS
jgi:hypothetical protein